MITIAVFGAVLHTDAEGYYGVTGSSGFSHTWCAGLRLVRTETHGYEFTDSSARSRWSNGRASVSGRVTWDLEPRRHTHEHQRSGRFNRNIVCGGSVATFWELM